MQQERINVMRRLGRFTIMLFARYNIASTVSKSGNDFTFVDFIKLNFCRSLVKQRILIHRMAISSITILQ